MLTNYLAAEPLIIARLQEKVTGVKAVLSAADLDGVEAAKQTVPALHVLFGGYRPTREQGEGTAQETEQTWWVVVAVKNLRDPKTGTKARSEAGPFMVDVQKALQGWRPDPDLTPLKLSPAPKGGFSAGFGYYPLAFTTKTVIKGDQ